MSFNFQNSKFVINNSLKKNSQFPVSFETNDFIIYEVIRLIKKKILFLPDHLERFYKSFHCVGREMNFTHKDILKQLKQLIDSNQIFDGNIKFQINISLETSKQSFYAYLIPHSYPLQEQYELGVPVSVVKVIRQNPNAKVQQTELRKMIDQILKKENSYEAILVNQEGIVTEGSRSNLFMIKNDKIFTAQNKDILPGITRKHILQICKHHNIAVLQQPIALNQLQTMDAIFITGTSPKVLPINLVSTYKFDVLHPLLRKIMKQFDELIEKNLQSIPDFYK